MNRTLIILIAAGIFGIAGYIYLQGNSDDPPVKTTTEVAGEANDVAAQAVGEAADAVKDAAAANADVAAEKAKEVMETLGDAVEGAVESAGSAASDAAEAASEAVDSTTQAVGDAAKAAGVVIDATKASAAGSIDSLMTDGALDYDKVEAAIAASDMSETNKSILRTAASAAKNNPAMLDALTGQLKAMLAPN